MNNYREACSYEAMLAGYPAQAGYDLYDIHIKHKQLSTQKYTHAILELQCLYGKKSREGIFLSEVISKCYKIVALTNSLLCDTCPNDIKLVDIPDGWMCPKCGKEWYDPPFGRRK